MYCIIFQSSGPGLSFPDAILPNLLTLDDGETETNLTLMGVGAGPILQPVSLEHSMEAESGGGGDKSPQPVLTQLNNSDFKFGGIDFRAEFISQPITSLASAVAGVGGDLGGGDGGLVGLGDLVDGTTSLSVNLPSFSDTYPTKPVITTIEPRMFGAEAEYEARLRLRHASKQSSNGGGGFPADTLRLVDGGEAVTNSSSRGGLVSSSPGSPVSSLGLLPNLHTSIETYLSSQETGSLSESESSYAKTPTDPSSVTLPNSPLYSKQDSLTDHHHHHSHSPVLFGKADMLGEGPGGLFSSKHDLVDPTSLYNKPPQSVDHLSDPGSPSSIFNPATSFGSAAENGSLSDFIVSCTTAGGSGGGSPGVTAAVDTVSKSAVETIDPPDIKMSSASL